MPLFVMSLLGVAAYLGVWNFNNTETAFAQDAATGSIDGLS